MNVVLLLRAAGATVPYPNTVVFVAGISPVTQDNFHRLVSVMDQMIGDGYHPHIELRSSSDINGSEGMQTAEMLRSIVMTE